MQSIKPSFLKINCHFLKRCSLKNLTSSSIRPSSYLIENLTNRALIRVSGKESENYLQGLITNDMRHFEKSSCIFSLFLNNKGRVLYDTLIYKNPKDLTSFLIECDKQIVDEFSKYLKIFRVRKKIDISREDNLDVWTIFNSNLNISKESTLDINQLKIKADLIYCRDPRLAQLGFRLLIPKEMAPLEIVEEPAVELSTLGLYRPLRYQLGVGEGVDELTPGKALPLESNGDYLHGVSFHKGCYIGQELTARSHHTGVIRKRLMPILIKNLELNLSAKTDDSIEADESKKSIGKLKGLSKNVGLALLRINEALSAKELKLASVQVETLRPTWWPQESPKEIKKN